MKKINDMEIKLNDKSYEVTSGTTLAEFVDSLGLSLTGIAIAIDYEVVPKKVWNDTILIDGMSLMLIQAVSGG